MVALPGKGGKDPADYAGLDVAGKVVLTNAAAVPGGRAGDPRASARRASSSTAWPRAGAPSWTCPDARQYTSFWFAGEVQPYGWGFVLSPRQGRALRASLAAANRCACRPASAAVSIPARSRWWRRSSPATPGEANEILMVSHLCHPRPGANDNASGAAALLETAATLGAADRPGRAARAAPRHPLHLGAGDDRHLRLAGRAARPRCAAGAGSPGSTWTWSARINA